MSNIKVNGGQYFSNLDWVAIRYFLPHPPPIP